MKLLDIEINILLKENGIYCLGFNGASGKSYLYELLESYSNNKRDEVLALTFNSKFNDNFIISCISDFRGKYIILDRLDLYFSKAIRDALISKSKSCIILIDLKNNISLRRLPIKLACIKLYNNRLEVCKK